MFKISLIIPTFFHFHLPKTHIILVMSPGLFLDNKKYISAKEAGILTGYSTDYIGQLSRANKVDSKRIGRIWYVSEDSILNYNKTDSQIEVLSPKIEPKEISRQNEILETAKKKDFSVSRDIEIPHHKRVISEVLFGFDFGFYKHLLPFTLGLALTLGVVSLKDLNFSNISKNISSAPKDVYYALYDVTDFYSEKLARNYILVGDSLISESQSFIKNPGAYASLELKGLSHKTSEFVSSAGSGFSRLTSGFLNSPNSLLASLSTIDTSSLSIYNGINSLFTRFIYSPIANLFTSEPETIYVAKDTPVTTGSTSSPQAPPTKQIATTNNTTIINQPVIERVREVVTTIPSDITRQELEKRLQELSKKFVSDIALQFSRLSTGGGGSITNIYQQIANSQKIDNLYNTAISNPTITGGFISNVTLGASSLSATNAGVGTLSVTGDSTFSGNVGIGTSSPRVSLHIDSTGGMIIPVGTTAQRPSVSQAGIIRYNTTNSTFEGYSGTTWSGLGGVIDVDQDTYILSELSPGSDEDTLYFYTAGTEKMRLSTVGYLGLGTSTPQSHLEIFQSTNGTPIISVYRNTDLAPTGDFINYKTKAGTTLFRVDNSGNLLAGGIINTGSQTITSVSTPQFRLQYDASNEITFSTTNNGSTTIATNGTNSAINFTPQNNQVNAWNFTNAAGTSILNIDSTNQRVGIGSTTPGYKLSVAGSAYFDGGTVTASIFTATSSITASTFPYASTTNITSTGYSAFATAGGLVGIGTTTPWGLLSVNPSELGTNVPSFVVGSSSGIKFIVNNAGNIGIGSTTPSFALSVEGSSYVNGTTTSTGLIVRKTIPSAVFDTGSQSSSWQVSANCSGNGRLIFSHGTTTCLLTDNPYAYLDLSSIGLDFATDRQLMQFTSGSSQYGFNGIPELYAPNSTKIKWSGGNGTLLLTDSNATDWSRLILGVNDTTGVSLVKSGTTLKIRDGNNTNDVILSTGFLGVGTSTLYYGTTLASTTGPQLALSAGGGIAQWTLTNMGGDFLLGTTTVAGNATTSVPAVTVLGSNGVVGIGTSTPFASLSINNNAGLANFAIGSSTGTYFIVDKNGNIGIGTSTPARKLVLDNPGRGNFSVTGGLLYIDGTSGGDTAALLFSHDGINRISMTSGVSTMAFSSPGEGSSITLLTGAIPTIQSPDSNKSLAFTAGGTTERMRITPQGNLAISTSTAYYGLTIASTTGPQLSLSAGGGYGQWTLANEGGNFYLSTTTVAGNATTSTSALSIIGSTGNVGIGTTWPGVSGIASRTYLTISGSTEAGALQLLTQTADADGNSLGLVEFVDKNSTTANARRAAITSTLSGATANQRGGTLNFLTAPNAGTLESRMTIDRDGNIGIGTTTPTGLLHVRTSTAAFSATGGTITMSGAYTIHTFTSDGTFTPNGVPDNGVEYLVVGGGGGGGSNTGGGGGAGGFRTGTGFTVSAQAYTITVGAAGSANSGDGGSSTFSSITSTGGGGGGTAGVNGRAGGSGGGAGGAAAATGGAGTGGQGTDGGDSTADGSPYGSGGGGGASEAGADETAGVGGKGGDGTSSSISGSAVTYAGGGGGGVYTPGTNGAGGAGGGGAGAAGTATAPTAGTTNRGGGGGGGGEGPGNLSGAAGGSGIVIIRYLTNSTIPSPTESLFVNSSSGNVGIGTTNPGSRLEVENTASADDVLLLEDSSGLCEAQPTTTGLTWSCSSDERLKMNIGAPSDVLGYITAIPLKNYTVIATGENVMGPIAQELLITNPELVRMGDDGFYQVSEISPWKVIKSIQELASSTSALSTSTTTPSIYVMNNSYVGIGTSTPSAPLHIYSNSLSGGVATFENANASCTIDPTNSSLTCSSDEKLKKDIVTIDTTTTLNKLLQLRPVTYHWKGEGETTQTHTGFIAQEVEQVFPEFVSTDSQGRKSVAYSNFIPAMVSAIQQLNTKVTTIDTRLTNLETLVASFTPQNTGGVLIVVSQWLASAGNGIVDVFAGTFRATDKLCINDTCVTETQLQALLANVDSVPTNSQTPNPDPGQATSTDSTNSPQTDTSSPTITVLGDNPAIVTTGTSYADLGATVTDTNTDGSVNNSLGLHFNLNGVDMNDISINTFATSTNTIVYSAVDSAGNFGYATRTVEVIEQ